MKYFTASKNPLTSY